MAKPKAIEVEGLRELNKAIRKAVDTDLPKRMAQANKKIGELVISKLEPRPVPEAVGAGAGSAIRPSASLKGVLIRVGGKHRTGAPGQQWGRVHVSSIGAAPARPFILGSAAAHEPEIAEAYLEGVIEAMEPAFHEAD